MANSAQRVVSDMHHVIEHQNKKIGDLESTIGRLQLLCEGSLRIELEKLEAKKKELVLELEKTDLEIMERQDRLKTVQEEIALSWKPSTRDENPSAKLRISKHVPFPSQEPDLDEQYIEESELLASIRDKANVLFIIHRNNVPDIIVYTPTERDVEIAAVYKIADIALKQFIELSTIEKMMVKSTALAYLLYIHMQPFLKIYILQAYGAKLVPNHERDFPDVKEIEVPVHLISDQNARQHGTEARTGQLLGAFEIPLTPGVIIDVWKEAGCDESDPLYWVTTPVDSVGFAVLERLYVVSEMNWGVPSVVQVNLFGRHPMKGCLLLESVISPSD